MYNKHARDENAREMCVCVCVVCARVLSVRACILQTVVIRAAEKRLSLCGDREREREEK